jgi:hypothetical protein
MCGIVGFITAEEGIGAVERKRWFLNALRAGVVRGDDGTGAFLVGHKQDGAADWCKMGTPPEPFLATKLALERFGASNDFDKYRAVIGHNRSATIGSVSTANAHPFQEGPITLVHNGTLNTTHSLPTPKSKLKDADVDSHMITHNLATHSVAEVVRELDGAYALVWHDARDQSVNIIRNDKRPLHLLPLKFHKTILMASEAEMLWWLTERSSFTPGGEIYYPEPGYHLKFTPDGGIKPSVTKLTMHSWRGFHGGGGRRPAWDDDYEGYRDNWYARSGMGGRRDEGSAVMEGPNMGKAPTRPPVLEGPHINKDALNRRVPKPLAATLETLNLLPLDKLRMEVTYVQPVHGTSHAVVIGNLVDLGRPPRTAHVYGLNYEAVKGAETRKETWTVAPNGVKAVSQYVQIVLVRLLARTASTRLTETPPFSPLSQDTPAASSTEEAPEVEDLWEAMTPDEQLKWLMDQTYLDQNGNEVTYSTWLTLTEGGCCYCKESIEPEFAEEMTWDIDTKLPVCPECSADLNDEVDLSAAS